MSVEPQEQQGASTNRSRAWPPLAAGLALYLAMLVVLELWIDPGPAEFAYFPFAPGPMPFAPMRGFTFEQLIEHLARLLLGAPALVLVGLGVSRLLPERVPSAKALRRITIAVTALSLAVMTFSLVFVFRDRALVDDALAYRSQAALLAEGRLAADELPALRSEPFVIKTRRGYTEKYLFGEPLVQLPGYLLGVPALAHLPLAALSLLFVFWMLRLGGAEEEAYWATMLLALSPMLLLTTPQGISQPSSLFCAAGVGLGYQLCRCGRPKVGALLVGFLVGFGIAVRPQAMLPIGAVFGSLVLWRLIRDRSWGALALLFLSGGLWVLAIAAYNTALSGSALVPPMLLTTTPDRYGFGQIWQGEPFHHNLRTLLENLATVALRFNLWWLGWPCSWLVLVLWQRLGRPLCPSARLYGWGLAGAAIILFEAGYFSTGVSDSGPIYHYELLIPGALLGAFAITGGLACKPRLVLALLIVNFGLGTAAFVPYHLSRLSRMGALIHERAERLLAKLPDRSLLLYEGGCAEAYERLGWVYSAFPKRFRSQRDRVVTHVRPAPEHLAAFLKHYRDRSCWYFHRNPGHEQRPELVRCEEAMSLLKRPVGGRQECAFTQPTAMRLGLYDPFAWRQVSAPASSTP